MSRRESDGNSGARLDRAAAYRDIQSSDSELIVSAAKILSESRETSTTESLVEMLKHEQRPENRQGILYALAWHGSLDTWGLMVQIFGDSREEPKVRGQAAEALSYMFMKQRPDSEAFKVAINALIAAINDPSPEVRYCALHAMGSSGHLPLVPFIKSKLDDKVAAPGWVGTVADEAARALEWIVDMSEQRDRQIADLSNATHRK